MQKIHIIKSKQIEGSTICFYYFWPILKHYLNLEYTAIEGKKKSKLLVIVIKGIIESL